VSGAAHHALAPDEQEETGVSAGPRARSSAIAVVMPGLSVRSQLVLSGRELRTGGGAASVEDSSQQVARPSARPLLRFVRCDTGALTAAPAEGVGARTIGAGVAG
jgi:hypothetical protein